MRKVKIISTIVFLLINSLAVFAAEVERNVEISFPAEMEWILVENEQDAFGYIKTFQPKEQIDNKIQSVIINYSKEKISLEESMAQVQVVMSKADCKQKDAHVIQQSKDILVFATLLDQCTNGKSLVQVFKVFNAKEGQFSVIYNATPELVDASVVQRMQHVVESAVIR